MFHIGFREIEVFKVRPLPLGIHLLTWIHVKVCFHTSITRTSNITGSLRSQEKGENKALTSQVVTLFFSSLNNCQPTLYSWSCAPDLMKRLKGALSGFHPKFFSQFLASALVVKGMKIKRCSLLKYSVSCNTAHNKESHYLHQTWKESPKVQGL